MADVLVRCGRPKRGRIRCPGRAPGTISPPGLDPGSVAALQVLERREAQLVHRAHGACAAPVGHVRGAVHQVDAVAVELADALGKSSASMLMFSGAFDVAAACSAGVRTSRTTTSVRRPRAGALRRPSPFARRIDGLGIGPGRIRASSRTRTAHQEQTANVRDIASVSCGRCAQPPGKPSKHSSSRRPSVPAHCGARSGASVRSANPTEPHA